MIQMLNRSRIKLKLIIADKRLLFLWAFCTYSSSCFGKMASTVRISSQRYISCDTMHVVNIPFHLIYGKLYCVRPKNTMRNSLRVFISISCKCARSINKIVVLYFCFFFRFCSFSPLLSPCCGLRNVRTPFEFVNIIAIITVSVRNCIVILAR